MFVQVIRGKTKDPKALKDAMDRWMRDLAPGADGHLGATAGVADDGAFIATARFSDEAAARRNSDRPEQGEWWSEAMEPHLDDVTFDDCTDVDAHMGDDCDRAGFVQVMSGKTTNQTRLRDLDRAFADAGNFRPDILGSLSCYPAADRWVQLIYFTSEAEAREGEKKEMPEHLRPVMEEFQQLASDVEFIDIREPWLYSP